VTCTKVAPGVVVCTSGGTALRRDLARCPVCECTTEWVVYWPANPWHEPRSACTKCGEVWHGGEPEARPFARGWRKRQQQRARADYANATYGPPPPVDWIGWGFQRRKPRIITLTPEPDYL
jgi:hypothetical protein